MKLLLPPCCQAADKKGIVGMWLFTFPHSCFCDILHNRDLHFFFPAQRDNCVSSFRSHYVLIVIIYMLPGGCAIIKMQFESFKRLQLSQAQNLVYIQLLARKSLTAQQFISNGPKKPMHSQKQKCEEKCQPLWYKY